MGPDTIELKAEALDSMVVRELLVALNAELLATYPEQGALFVELDPEEVEDGRGIFLVARREGHAIGCAGLRVLDDDTAEIKRMYVVPECRRYGVAQRLLDALEAHARAQHIQRLVLETGDRLHGAMRLYTNAGFERIASFGEYADSPLSVCFGKALSAETGLRSRA